MSISLVYIARGENAGFTAINKFIRSYKNFNSGCDHELIVVFKGWPKDKLQDEKILRNEFKKLNANILEFDDDGFDWGVYMRVTKNINTEYICFLNTFSRPLNHNWLKNFYNAIKLDDVGMCGATSSYKAWKFSLPLFQWNFSSVLTYPLKTFRRVYNNISLYGHYPDDFSPHIRSNGFIVKTQQFSDFISKSQIPITKRDCYKLESGNLSYSYHLIKNNYRLLAVDNLGVPYDIDEWVNSYTYCCPGQPGLCIADNNTDTYKNMNINKKKQMEYEVWGKVLS